MTGPPRGRVSKELNIAVKWHAAAQVGFPSGFNLRPIYSAIARRGPDPGHHHHL
jgi:hypothetical protein